MPAQRPGNRFPLSRKACLIEGLGFLLALALLFLAFLHAGPGYGLLVITVGLLIIRNREALFTSKGVGLFLRVGVQGFAFIVVDLSVYLLVGALISLIIAVFFVALEAIDILWAPTWLVRLAQFFAMTILVGLSLNSLDGKSEKENFGRELEMTPEEDVAEHEKNQRAIRSLLGLKGSFGEGYRAPKAFLSFSRFYHRRPSLGVVLYWAALTGLCTQVSVLISAPDRTSAYFQSLEGNYGYFAMSSIDLVLLGLPGILGVDLQPPPSRAVPSHAMNVLAHFGLRACHVLYVVAFFFQLRAYISTERSLRRRNL